MLNRYNYNKEFFDYIEGGARRSATNVVRIVLTLLKSTSVLDVGCGRGVWLDEWMKAGIRDCMGVDGDYVDANDLAIPQTHFVARDLSKEIDLGRTFDIVQSLEVAEHIDRTHADVFVTNLCRHGEVILFSAAVPGQGGETHVNEQPLDYWRHKFKTHGYSAFDPIRPMISKIRDVEPWYRYNTLVYATDKASEKLPPAVKATRLPANKPVPEIAPLPWRVRNATLRCLPAPAVHQLAVLKHKAINLVRR